MYPHLRVSKFHVRTTVTVRMSGYIEEKDAIALLSKLSKMAYLARDCLYS